MTEERNCENCKHHGKEGCRSWECKFDEQSDIEQLQDLRAHCQDMTRGDGIIQDLWEKDVKALDKAIEALKRQQEGKMEIIKLEKRTPEEKAAYLEGYEAGKKKSQTEIAKETLEDIKAEICDTRCKWPELWDESQGELCESEHCANCPLNRL